MTEKLRVYDLAKELRCSNKFIIEEVKREGIDVSVPSDTITSDVAERIRVKYAPKTVDFGHKNISVESYHVDSIVRECWRAYPVRILGHSTCGSCSEPTVLVQSMESGFITRNCPKCNLHDTLPESIFRNNLDLWVACPRCKKRMEPDVLLDKNYGYVCRSCNVSIALFELLPRYEDL